MAPQVISSKKFQEITWTFDAKAKVFLGSYSGDHAPVLISNFKHQKRIPEQFIQSQLVQLSQVDSLTVTVLDNQDVILTFSSPIKIFSPWAAVVGEGTLDSVRKYPVTNIVMYQGGVQTQYDQYFTLRGYSGENFCLSWSDAVKLQSGAQLNPSPEEERVDTLSVVARTPVLINTVKLDGALLLLKLRTGKLRKADPKLLDQLAKAAPDSLLKIDLSSQLDNVNVKSLKALQQNLKGLTLLLLSNGTLAFLYRVPIVLTHGNKTFTCILSLHSDAGGLMNYSEPFEFMSGKRRFKQRPIECSYANNQQLQVGFSLRKRYPLTKAYDPELHDFPTDSEGNNCLTNFETLSVPLLARPEGDQWNDDRFELIRGLSAYTTKVWPILIEFLEGKWCNEVEWVQPSDVSTRASSDGVDLGENSGSSEGACLGECYSGEYEGQIKAIGKYFIFKVPLPDRRDTFVYILDSIYYGVALRVFKEELGACMYALGGAHRESGEKPLIRIVHTGEWTLHLSSYLMKYQSRIGQKKKTQE